MADAKLKAFEKRGWLARLIGWRPKPAETESITLEALIRFHHRLKNVGMTPKQIDQILFPLYQSAGVPLTTNSVEEATDKIAEEIDKRRSEGRDLK